MTSGVEEGRTPAIPVVGVRPRLRVGSLCSGYEGLGMAVETVFPDAELAWVSDIDKGACKVLAHRYPDVPNIGDMTTVDWSSVEPVDVLTGGTPCQDLSHAGKRAGMTEGTRSNLWVAMREAIATIRPSLVIWENVEGAASAAADSEVEPCEGCVGDGSGVFLRALGRVVGDLSSLGYVGCVRSVRASDVGAPHRRARRFLVATDARSSRRDWRAQAPQRESVGGAAATRRGALLPSPRTSERGQPLSEVAVNALLPTPAVNDMGAAYTPETWDAWTDDMKARHGNGNGHGKSLAIEAQRLLGTPTARNAPRSVEYAASPDRWGDYAAAIARWEHTLGRPAPAPTMISSKGNPQLSPAFTEWMMGLPEGWVTDTPGVTRNEALKLCGNGVVPQQAEAAIRFLLDVMQTPPTPPLERKQHVYT